MHQLDPKLYKKDILCFDWSHISVKKFIYKRKTNKIIKNTHYSKTKNIK